MAEVFVELELQPAPLGRPVPEWMWGPALRVRVWAEDLERLYGGSTALTPSQLAEFNSGEIGQALSKKVGRLHGRPMEPVSLTFDDFLN